MFHHPIHPPAGVSGRRPEAAVDQRAAKRHATVLLIGRVRRSDGDESACLVHDISAGGLMARFTCPPQVGDRLWISVRGLAEAAAHVVWVDGFKGGVAFDVTQDIAGVFIARNAQGHVVRAPRFAIDTAARLRIGDRRIVVRVRDVSAGGVKLASDAAPLSGLGLAPGIAASLRLPMLDEALFGTICWVRDGHAGFRFSTPLPLPRLSLVLA